jgi:serine/threonine-protein kinase RsbW
MTWSMATASACIPPMVPRLATEVALPTTNMPMDFCCPAWSWTLDASICSIVGSTRRAVRNVVDQLKTHGWPPPDVFGVHLALEEALVNAIKHGNGFDACKRVHLQCKVAAARIWIQVRDEGPGFNPARVPDCTAAAHLTRPSGRGVMLMRTYMSRVEYNAAGNCVVMEKVREPAA